MKYLHQTLILFAAIAMVFAASTATANIYLDEGFEDGSPFTDQNWRIVGDDAIEHPPTPPATIATTQGTNVRRDGVDSETDKVAVSTTGSVSDARGYLSNHSLQLAPGQSVSLDTPTYAYDNGDWWKVFQFVVTVDAASLALADGTTVGHFRQVYNVGTGTFTYQLNLVSNGSGVDLVVENSGAVVGTITAEDDWQVVTVLNHDDVTPEYDGEDWEAYNPFTQTYIGPQPTNPNIPPDPAWTQPEQDEQYQNFDAGHYTYVNSNTAADFIAPATIGAQFGADGSETELTDWEITAVDGTLFVDELAWSHGLFQWGKGASPSSQEGAARMVPFEVQEPPVNAASHWMWVD